MRMWRVVCGVAAALVLTTGATQASAASILVSGNSMFSGNANLTGAIAGLGHTATFVAPNEFETTSFAGFDAIWLDGFSFYGTGSWSSNLVTFIQSGGNVLIQSPGFGSETLSFYPLANNLASTFTFPPGDDSIRVVDTTSPAGANHGVNAGVTDAGLSNWNVSAAGIFTSIDDFTGVTDSGTDGEWITIVKQVGNGFLVYTQLGVSQFLGSDANPGASSEAALFLDNVVTLSATSVPEASSLATFLAGIGLVGTFRLATRRRRTPRA